MKKRVLAFGEVLLRLSPPSYQLFRQAHCFDSSFGGSELNVLAILSQLGHSVELMTALPEHELGQMACQALSSFQIGQKYLVQKPGRLGVYYYQKGFSVRSSQIIYDRTNSVFAQSTATDYNLDSIFEEIDWFHVSGITVALNPSLYQLTMDLMKQAKKREVKVSFDLNYRESLWNSFGEARTQLTPFVGLADICFGLEPIELLTEDGKDLKDQLDLQRPYENREVLLQVLEKISQTYSVDSIAFTQREIKDANEHHLKGYLYQEGQLHETDSRTIRVLDRVGTGDAFTAGIIAGYLAEEAPREILDKGMASFLFKHSITGDFGIVSSSALTAIATDQSYDIQR